MLARDPWRFDDDHNTGSINGDIQELTAEGSLL